MYINILRINLFENYEKYVFTYYIYREMKTSSRPSAIEGLS